jgi:HPt (histidine-containing phosphotransfer) domain-containing protein
VAREQEVLDAALARGDWHGLGRAAHALAGQVALVGARKVADLARALQVAAERGALTPESARAALAELKTAWSAADAALQRELNALAPSRAQE